MFVPKLFPSRWGEFRTNLAAGLGLTSQRGKYTPSLSTNFIFIGKMNSSTGERNSR